MAAIKNILMSILIAMLMLSAIAVIYSKYQSRLLFIEIQNKENKHIIIDGHLVFAKGENDFENVMTKADATFYTDYIYLNLPTEIILQRQQNDTVRKRNHNANTISNWKVYELKELKLFCNKNNLPLHILETADTKSTVDFICNYIRE